MTVRVQAEPFDVGREIERLHQDNPKIGAIASFIGLVRDVNEGDPIRSLTLEHYPGMTETSLNEIVKQAKERWNLIDVVVIHRIGALQPTDQIVLVAVASAHRGEAFAACEFLIDYLKTRAPFWKKEETPAGARWVEARSSDDEAAGRWASARKREA
ncbi:MAG TPA: molybdopterin synthase catalytic subunit MoaE [Burkholderiales bacterium]|nr:molybdopterin synthase catalytic subunit MoaE [Burkholderiales bacterium]